MAFFDFPRYDIAENDVIDQIIWEGSAENGVLIFLKKSDFGEPERAFLAKVIAAVGRELTSCKIGILPDEKTIRISADPGFSKYRYLLMMGLIPDELSMRIETAPYELVKIGDKIICFTSSLPTILDDQNNKKYLWTALKGMFEV